MNNIVSKEKIKKCFLQLLQEKPFKEINVSELCSKANYHRSTFYLYYHNLEELLFDVQTDILNNVKPYFIDYYNGNNLTIKEKEKYLYQIILGFVQEKDLIILMIHNNDSNLLTTNLSLHMKRLILDEKSDKESDYRLTYHFMGIISVVSTWLLENQPIPAKQLARIIANP